MPEALNAAENSKSNNIGLIKYLLKKEKKNY